VATPFTFVPIGSTPVSNVDRTGMPPFDGSQVANVTPPAVNTISAASSSVPSARVVGAPHAVDSTSLGLVLQFLVIHDWCRTMSVSRAWQAATLSPLVQSRPYTVSVDRMRGLRTLIPGPSFQNWHPEELRAIVRTPLMRRQRRLLIALDEYESMAAESTLAALPIFDHLHDLTLFLGHPDHENRGGFTTGYDTRGFQRTLLTTFASSTMSHLRVLCLDMDKPKLTFLCDVLHLLGASLTHLEVDVIETARLTPYEDSLPPNFAHSICALHNLRVLLIGRDREGTGEHRIRPNDFDQLSTICVTFVAAPSRAFELYFSSPIDGSFLWHLSDRPDWSSQPVSLPGVRWFSMFANLPVVEKPAIAFEVLLQIAPDLRTLVLVDAWSEDDEKLHQAIEDVLTTKAAFPLLQSPIVNEPCQLRELILEENSLGTIALAYLASTGACFRNLVRLELNLLPHPFETDPNHDEYTPGFEQMIDRDNTRRGLLFPHLLRLTPHLTSLTIPTIAIANLDIFLHVPALTELHQLHFPFYVANDANDLARITQQFPSLTTLTVAASISPLTPYPYYSVLMAMTRLKTITWITLPQMTREELSAHCEAKLAEQEAASKPFVFTSIAPYAAAATATAKADAAILPTAATATATAPPFSIGSTGSSAPFTFDFGPAKSAPVVTAVAPFSFNPSSMAAVNEIFGPPPPPSSMFQFSTPSISPTGSAAVEPATPGAFSSGARVIAPWEMFQAQRAAARKKVASTATISSSPTHATASSIPGALATEPMTPILTPASTSFSSTPHSINGVDADDAMAQAALMTLLNSNRQ
jgi:hypothetical protein